jgi:hypothetical protein
MVLGDAKTTRFNIYAFSSVICGLGTVADIMPVAMISTQLVAARNIGCRSIVDCTNNEQVLEGCVVCEGLSGSSEVVEETEKLEDLLAGLY